MLCFSPHNILDKLRRHHNDLLLQQDIDERRERAALHTNLVQYWATHQRAEDSRDADLKCDLKGAVRITVPEGQLGPASMQIYLVFIKRLLGTSGPASNTYYEQTPVAVSLFLLQGDTNTKEQKKREQIKTERVLQAQIQDNERRRSGEKHRGGKTHTLSTAELALRYNLCYSHTCFTLSCTNNHTLPRTALTARWH